MPIISEYDQRQYQRMIEVINDYLEKRVSLAILVSTLDGLIGALENISNTQRNDLLSRWGVLEETYAIGLDESSSDVELKYAEIISDGIQDFRLLVKEQSGQ